MPRRTGRPPMASAPAAPAPAETFEDKLRRWLRVTDALNDLTSSVGRLIAKATLAVASLITLFTDVGALEKTGVSGAALLAASASLVRRRLSPA